MTLNNITKCLLCTIFATIVSLTTHIYLMKWMQPSIIAIVDQLTESGININPNPSTYSYLIIDSAYVTAAVMIGIYVFLYYQVQQLIHAKTTCMKALIVTAILFGIKGDLVRQPIMDLIMTLEWVDIFTSLKFVTLNHLDKWLANIFLSFCLVYLCPKKSD